VRPVLTAEEARRLEADAEAQGTGVETLMERAGHAVARAVGDLAGGVYGRRAVVIAGKGNNAGDGFVAARHLDSWGMKVTVLLVSEPGELREPASTILARLSRSSVRVAPFGDSVAEREFARADVAVDAIFGLGLRGAPKDPYAAAMLPFEMHDVPVVAVDIASGVESDTGSIPGPSVAASVTVSFGSPKVGNVLPPGAYRCGHLQVVDIGYPSAPGGGAGTSPPGPWPIGLVELGEVKLPPPRGLDAHKRDAVVLVLGGSRRMTGAPALVAEGAYRAGAGLVVMAVPASILPVAQSSIREAVFLPLAEDGDGVVSERAWDDLEEILPTVHAVALGPGLSRQGEAPALVRRLVRDSGVPMVIDADAINAFEGSAARLADRRADAVITPHHGELARLLGVSAGDVTDDLLGTARAAAEAANLPVLLKGWPNLLAAPDGNVKVERTGTSTLATAGTGDVLTGVIGGFLASTSGDASRPGPAPTRDSALAGAQVHGLAGRIGAERLGAGVTASDVARAIPEAIRRLREYTS
jgi:NAD(P)H-hydrate epimerase